MTVAEITENDPLPPINATDDYDKNDVTRNSNADDDKTLNICEDIKPKTNHTSKSTKLKKENDKIELKKHRHNIRQILLCSNATPIRNYNFGYTCCFCDEKYQEPLKLKQHTLMHDESTKKDFMKDKGLFMFLVKLDITSLHCTLCKSCIDTVETLMNHLNQEHNKEMYSGLKNYILPFKFDDAILKCVICMKHFNKFKPLQEHMYCHYRNYACEECGVGFVNEKMLLVHSKIHKTGSFKCGQCLKEFDTLPKKKSHEKRAHQLLVDKCGLCGNKFKNHHHKSVHLKQVHGIVNALLQCQACNKVFSTQANLTRHVKKDHLLERKLEKRFKCSECSMGFYFESMLKEHMVKHFGVKEYKCEVCMKMFVRKGGLRQHMRTHQKDRKIKCDICGRGFVQKCSWKGHMKSKHGEEV